MPLCRGAITTRYVLKPQCIRPRSLNNPLQGLKNFGAQIAHSLGRLGFGDQLLEEYERCQGRNMDAFLTRWRTDINTELHTNAHNLLRSRMPSLSVPETFPDMEVLRSYVSPICSASEKRPGGGQLRDNRELSIPGMATYCEDHFDEWGYRSMIMKRFRANVWEAAVMRILRRAALEADEKEKTRRIAAGRTDLAIRGPLAPSAEEEVGTPALLVKTYLAPTEVDRRAAAFLRDAPAVPEVVVDTNPLIRQVVGARCHVSTDYLPEYRVEVDPTQFVRLAEKGIMGKHPEPREGAAAADDFDEYPEFAPENEQNDAPPASQGSQGASGSQKTGAKKPPPDPYSTMRLWLPASIMRQVHPSLVEDFEAGEEAKKKAKKAGTPARKRKRREDTNVEAGHVAERPELAALPAPAPRPQVVPPAAAAPKPQVVQPAVGALPAESHAREPPSTPPRAGHTARIEIDVYAASSLPMRPCGFHFSFPNPDSPSMLVPDEDPNANVLVSLESDDEEPQVMSQVVQSAESSQASSSRLNRPQPDLPRQNRAESPTSNVDYQSDVSDNGVRVWQERMAESAHLPKNASARGPATTSQGARSFESSACGRGGGTGQDAPRAKRPRASAPTPNASSSRVELDASGAVVDAGGTNAEQERQEALDDERFGWVDSLLGLGNKYKRAPARGRGGRAARGQSVSDKNARVPKPNSATNTRDVSPPRVRAARRASPRPLSRARPATPPPSARGQHSFPMLSPLASRASSAEPSHRPLAAASRVEPLFLPSPSPPPPVAGSSRGHKRARSYNPDDVIEIDTSEDERPTVTQSVGKRRPPRRHRPAEPSSSQASRLSDGGLQRMRSIIDLT